MSRVTVAELNYESRLYSPVLDKTRLRLHLRVPFPVA